MIPLLVILCNTKNSLETRNREEEIKRIWGARWLFFLPSCSSWQWKRERRRRRRRRETKEPRLFFGLPFKFDNKEWTWIRHFLSLVKGKHFRPFSCLLFVRKFFSLSLSLSLFWYSIFLCLFCVLFFSPVCPFVLYIHSRLLSWERKETMLASYMTEVKEEEVDSRESSSALKRFQLLRSSSTRTKWVQSDNKTSQRPECRLKKSLEMEMTSKPEKNSNRTISSPPLSILFSSCNLQVSCMNYKTDSRKWKRDKPFSSLSKLFLYIRCQRRREIHDDDRPARTITYSSLLSCVYSLQIQNRGRERNKERESFFPHKAATEDTNFLEAFSSSSFTDIMIVSSSFSTDFVTQKYSKLYSDERGRGRRCV